MSTYSLSLAALMNARLTPDWQTVYTGWRGAVVEDGDEKPVSLSVADVQQFAADCLTGKLETDYPLIHVLDAEPTHQGLVREDAWLRDLASRSAVSENLARRKWRYAAAVTVPLEMPRVVSDPADLAYFSEKHIWYWEWHSTVAGFWNTWGSETIEPHLPFWEGSQEVNAWIESFRKWLAEEKAVLNESV